MISAPARRAQLKLYYDSVDISEDISRFLISWNYTDNSGGESDEFSITVENTTALWNGDWLPRKGAVLSVRLLVHDWVDKSTHLSGKSESLELDIGKFSIDKISFSGKPSVCNISALSAFSSATFKTEKKNRAWMEISLEEILNQIAEENGFKAYYEAGEIIFEEADQSHSSNDIELLTGVTSDTGIIEFLDKFLRLDQKNESDLAFLKRITDEKGLELKVSDEKIIVYDVQIYDAKDPVAHISLNSGGLKSYSLNTESWGIYESCYVQYFDPKLKTNINATYRATTDADLSKALKINKRAESLADAQRMAQKELRKANEKEVTGSLNLLGNPNLLASFNITLSEFNLFDGKYFIKKAVHSGNVSGGYMTSIDIRKTLDY